MKLETVLDLLRSDNIEDIKIGLITLHKTFPIEKIRKIAKNTKDHHSWNTIILREALNGTIRIGVIKDGIPILVLESKEDRYLYVGKSPNSSYTIVEIIDI